MELRPGNIVDRYVVLRHLGSGGTADVYVVQHRALGTRHALKVLRLVGSSVTSRVMREGRLQGRLKNRHVVSVTDMVNIGGIPGLIMDLVDGPLLDTWLGERRPTIDQVDLIAQGILTGMAAAHDLGMTHRDLKPSNVLLDIHGGTVVPKITDFGLAISEETGPRITHGGVMMGTPGYMAPEQARNARNADARSDVFSLGALLYELLTGRQAFPGDDLVHIAQQASTETYDPIDPRGDWPARMVDTVRAALSADPDQRPADAAQMLSRWRADTSPPDAVATWDIGTIMSVREAAPVLPDLDEDASRPGSLQAVLATANPAERSAHWDQDEESPVLGPVASSWLSLAPVAALIVLALAVVLGRSNVSFVDPSALHTAASPEARARFDQAVTALRSGALDEAYDHAYAASLLAPMDLGPYTVLRAIHAISDRGEPMAFAEREAKAIRAADTRLPRRSLLLETRRLSRTGDAAEAATARLARWAEDHPEDDIGLTTLVGYVPRLADRFTRRDDSALHWLVRVAELRHAGDDERALEIVRAGLSTALEAPSLRILHLQLLLEFGRAEEAYDVLNAMPQAMRDRLETRALETVMLLDRGETHRADRLAEVLRTSDGREEERVRALRALRRAYQQLGRVDRAVGFYEAERDLLRAIEDGPRLAQLQSEVRDMWLLFGHPFELAQLAKWETKVAILRADNPRWRGESTFRDAVTDAWSGRLEEAEQVLAELEAEDFTTLRDRLALEISASRGDRDSLRTAAGKLTGCLDRARAAWLLSRGQPDPALRTVLGDTVGQCDIAAEVVARISLARLADAQGDTDSALRQSQRVQMLWTHNDNQTAVHEALRALAPTARAETMSVPR